MTMRISFLLLAFFAFRVIAADTPLPQPTESQFNHLKLILSPKVWKIIAPPPFSTNGYWIINLFLREQINNRNVVLRESSGGGGTDSEIFWIYYLSSERWQIIATDRFGAGYSSSGNEEWNPPKQWQDLQASVTYPQRAKTGYMRKRFRTADTIECRVVRGEVFLGERTYEDTETGFKAKTWIGYRFTWHEESHR